MKRYLTLIVAALAYVSADAQKSVITGSKARDNWYVGFSEGVVSTMGTDKDGKSFKSTDLEGFYSDINLRVGKNLTTVFGIAMDMGVYFRGGKDSSTHNKTFVSHSNWMLSGTFNLSNAFLGYPGHPRQFEVWALTGLGWSHQYGRVKSINDMTSKIGFDFTMNLGTKQQWQVYVEPHIVYVLDSWRSSTNYHSQNGLKMNLNNSHIGINVGLNYKFKCSNGTHNFARMRLSDQTQLGYLKARIIELQGDLDSKSAKIAEDARTIAKDGEIIADLKSRLEKYEGEGEEKEQ